MALSMDEQRVLAEIERRLAAEEPRLAACMTSFRRPGPAGVLRSPRARILGSLFTVLLVAMISLMVYAIIPFRGAHTTRTPGGGTASAGSVTLSAAPTSGASAKTVTRTHASAAAVGRAATHATTAPAKGTGSGSGQSGLARHPGWAEYPG